MLKKYRVKKKEMKRRNSLRDLTLSQIDTIPLKISLTRSLVVSRVNTAYPFAYKKHLNNFELGGYFSREPYPFLVRAKKVAAKIESLVFTEVNPGFFYSSPICLKSEIEAIEFWRFEPRF